MKAENFINYKKKKMKLEYGLEVNIFTLIIKTSLWSWFALDILTLIEKKLFFVGARYDWELFQEWGWRRVELLFLIKKQGFIGYSIDAVKHLSKIVWSFQYFQGQVHRQKDLFIKL